MSAVLESKIGFFQRHFRKYYRPQTFELYVLTRLNKFYRIY